MSRRTAFVLWGATALWSVSAQGQEASPPTARFDDIPTESPPAPIVRSVAPVPDAAASLPASGLHGEPVVSRAIPQVDERLIVNPYTDMRLGARGAPIPEVDDLLIVNPYTSLLSASGASPVASSPGPGDLAPGALEVAPPSGFQGWVYLNGVALAALPARSAVLPGEHVLTVVPVAGAPFTVWLRVAAGETQRFRFAVGGRPGRPSAVSQTTPVSH